MKTMPIFKDKINEAEVPVTAPQRTSKESKIPLDAHEVLDFYKTHSEEIKGILRSMNGTNGTQKMFMLGYYVGYSKR